MKVYDPHRSTTEIRQASGNLGNFRVLLISIGLAVALLAIVYLVFAAIAPVGITAG